MPKKWFLPLLILLILTGLGLTRWHYVASASSTSGGFVIVKFKKDRWTGRTWNEVYGISAATGAKATERLASPPPAEGAENERDMLTYAYWANCALAAIWLWLAYFQPSLNRIWKVLLGIAVAYIAFIAFGSLLTILKLYQYQAIHLITIILIYNVYKELKHLPQPVYNKEQS